MPAEPGETPSVTPGDLDRYLRAGVTESLDNCAASQTGRVTFLAQVGEPKRARSVGKRVEDGFSGLRVRQMARVTGDPCLQVTGIRSIGQSLTVVVAVEDDKIHPIEIILNTWRDMAEIRRECHPAATPLEHEADRPGCIVGHGERGDLDIANGPGTISPAFDSLASASIEARPRRAGRRNRHAEQPRQRGGA